jgi:hypothetical protein
MWGKIIPKSHVLRANRGTKVEKPRRVFILLKFSWDYIRSRRIFVVVPSKGAPLHVLYPVSAESPDVFAT